GGANGEAVHHRARPGGEVLGGAQLLGEDPPIGGGRVDLLDAHRRDRREARPGLLGGGRLPLEKGCTIIGRPSTAGVWDAQLSLPRTVPRIPPFSRMTHTSPAGIPAPR